MLNSNDAFELLQNATPGGSIVAEIFDGDTIRDRSRRIYDYVACGSSVNFNLDCANLENCATYVVNTIKLNYPNLNVAHHSRWNHFNIRGTNHAQLLLNKISSSEERLRVALELVIISVFLDAGAGADWSFKDPVTGTSLNRSEGLALASLRMYEDGVFSNDPKNPYRVDYGKLMNFKVDLLIKYFQVNNVNFLVGVSGRTDIINGVGETIDAFSMIFEKNGDKRLGHIADYFLSISSGDEISLHKVFKSILYIFSKIWRGKYFCGEINLGDTWEHPALQRYETFRGLIPFHKLSQWLTYSMIEPLEDFGLVLTETTKLTGLPEYRNGGLFMDLGVIAWKDRSFPAPAYPPSSPVIVEWRAMTVVLLDMLAVEVRRMLQKTATDFPLTKVLEGGSWAAGRKIANELRPDCGSPPISIVSDATVF